MFTLSESEAGVSLLWQTLRSLRYDSSLMPVIDKVQLISWNKQNLVLQFRNAGLQMGAGRSMSKFLRHPLKRQNPGLPPSGDGITLSGGRTRECVFKKKIPNDSCCKLCFNYLHNSEIDIRSSCSSVLLSGPAPLRSVRYVRTCTGCYDLPYIEMCR